MCHELRSADYHSMMISDPIAGLAYRVAFDHFLSDDRLRACAPALLLPICRDKSTTVVTKFPQCGNRKLCACSTLFRDDYTLTFHILPSLNDDREQSQS